METNQKQQAFHGTRVLRWALLPLALLDPILNWIQDRIGIQRMGYLFILPNLLIFGIFIILPMSLNFVYGFTTGDSILLENRAYVGTQNIDRLLDCDDYTQIRTCDQDLFWRGVGNTIRYVVIEVLLINFLALITALALNQKVRGRGFFRSAFFYPVLLSPVVVALIWKWILQYQNGLLNTFLVHLGGERISFLTNPEWAQFWVIIISVWAQMGFYALILLAGLQSIPPEYYEAASIDGAGALSRLRHITLPLLKPVFFVVIVLSLIRAIQVFDLVYVLTGGGPGTATQYMVQFIYQTAFDDRNYGIASAASLLLAIFLLILTLIQFRLNRQAQEA